MFNLANKSGLAFGLSLTWLTMAAVVMPVFALLANYETHKIQIEAGAEDDCPFIWGAYSLSEVNGLTTVTGEHRVLCVYR